jgi:hypothetical protein
MTVDLWVVVAVVATCAALTNLTLTILLWLVVRRMAAAWRAASEGN